MHIFVSGILYALLFPKFNFYFLFPVVFIPLILFSIKSQAPPRKIFARAVAAGTLSNIIMLYWLYSVMVWNGVSFLSALAGLLIFAIYLGLYWGVFALILNRYRKSSRLFLLFLIPSLWIGLELIKTYLFTGFPWLLAGYSLWKIPVFLQVSSYAGIYGLSFIVLLINAGIALALSGKTFKPLAIASAAIILLISPSLISVGKSTPAPKARVAILQGNISQYKKWDPAFEQYILDTYAELYKKAADYSPDIIIWPETALPGALTARPHLRGYIKDLSRLSDAWQLVGSYETKGGKSFNSAYTIHPTGKVKDIYRKTHLTPFGEYVPFRAVLTPFVSVLGEFGDFSPGADIKPLYAADRQLAVGICYESIFPRIVRNAVMDGGGVFVNITNDGWFLQTAGPHQHFLHSIVRSVENRVWTVRASNTGISAIIDPTGRIIEKTSLMEKTALKGKIGFNKEKTFYSRFGDVFAYVIVALLIAGIYKEEKCLRNMRKK